MADDLSLLFRLKADSAQAKAVVADTRAAVAQLRQSFGPQLTQTVTVANKAFSDIGDNLQSFVTQRVPLVGGAIARITDGLRGALTESSKTERAIAGVAKSIESIAKESGKTVPQIASFLTKFVQLEGQAKRDAAAIEFLGAATAQKLIPELEKTGTALAAVSAESAGAGGAIAGIAIPIAVVVIALAAMTAGIVIASREIFQLTKNAADFQGKMFDLAQQTGLAVETLSALEVVARTTGGRLETITQAVVLFQRKLDEAQNPLSKTAELFRKFNIDTSDTETSLRSAFAALAVMPEGFAQTNAAAELFGARGGKQILAILKETNGDLNETIKRLREAGILISEDAARAADKFNDDLALLELQIRALSAVAAEDLIPVVAEMIRGFGDLLQAIRPVVSILSSFSAVALRPVAQSMKGLSLIVQALTGDYKGLAKAIKEANEAQNIKPLSIPGLTPVPLPSPLTAREAAGEAVAQAEAVVGAVKRAAAEQGQALDELFQRGRRNRQQQAEETIAANAQILKAEQTRIDAQIALRQQEVKALDEAQQKRGEIVRRDTEDYKAITAEVEKLQQERLDKENLFNVTSREIRARAAKERADSTRNQIQNETDILVNEFDRQIKSIEAEIQRGARIEEEGLTIIEQLEQAKVEARIDSRQRQKDVGFLTVEDQREIDAEIQKLQQEKDRLGDEQRARRLQRERNTAQQVLDITLANLDTLVQLEQIAGQRRIDTAKALADLRVITEEEAARQILQIRLDLIDDEIEATRAKITATAAIVDKDERVRAAAELNNQLKILIELRKGIQADGDREIDEGRRKDIDNERRYADDLQDIRDRIRQIELDTAEEVIRLMQIHFASRRDIIRAQTQLDLDNETERHRQVEQRLNDLQRENRESRKTEREKLEFEKELNRLREAEAERHRKVMQGIRDQGRKDEEEATPLGRFEFDIENLKEFASVVEESIVPLGQILTSTFLQVADAIGQTVANWVLLGETGPAVMRKILAQALAALAAEAAVQAIKELALGFATLFFNPAESASHFTAAALWGSIAGVAAIAGRGVAGDLFKSKGAGAGSGTSSERGTGQLSPLALERNIVPPRPEVKVIIEARQDRHSILDVFVEDFQQGGKTREVVNNDGVFVGG